MPALLIILAIVAFVLSLAWHFSRSRSILDQWAKANGYELLDSQYRNLIRGPFFWTTSKGQTVYYIKVRDPAGRIRTGYIRCGSYWGGLFSDKTDVRWDDEP